MKKKIAIILILCLVATGIIFYVKRPKNPDILTLFGNIEIRQTDLSFQVSGQIKEMLKEEGDEVKKGDLMAILDDRDYVSNLEKASAQVARLTALKADADDIYERKFPLCFDNTVSKTECETISHRKDEAKANLEAALAERNFAKNQSEYTKIYAPDEGIVLTRAQETGATVQKSQIVYTVSKTHPMWVRTYVSERDLGNIAYDMKAKVSTDSTDPLTGKKREYIGHIGYISPVAEFTPKTVQTEDLRTDLVYRVRVYVDDVDKFLRQGMPVTVKINLKDNSKNGGSN